MEVGEGRGGDTAPYTNTITRTATTNNARPHMPKHTAQLDKELAKIYNDTTTWDNNNNQVYINVCSVNLSREKIKTTAPASADTRELRIRTQRGGPKKQHMNSGSKPEGRLSHLRRPSHKKTAVLIC